MVLVPFHLFAFQIWDIQDQCCLFTADSKASKIHGDISACSYFPAMKSLFIAADCLAMLSLKMRLVVLFLHLYHHKIQCFLKIFHRLSNLRTMVYKIVKKKTASESYREVTDLPKRRSKLTAAPWYSPQFILSFYYSFPLLGHSFAAAWLFHIMSL